METNHHKCLNCATKLGQDTKFCPHCGQSVKFRNLSLGFVISTFFSTFLNLDSKLFHSFKDILIPNAITKSFIAGKRNYYVHPFRFYFFCLIACFGLLSLNTRHLDVDINQADLVGKYEQYAMMDTLHLANKAECERSVLDSLRKQTPRRIKNLASDTFINMDLFGTDFEDYGISTYDAFTLSEKELEEKYNVTGKLNRLILHQFIRVQKDQGSVVKAIIANMLWGILLLTVIMAFVLSILYIRHKSYFIEHLLHISNFHSLGLLLISTLLLLMLFVDINEAEDYVNLIVLATIPYLFTSLKRYYNQGFWKTLLKMILIGFGYIFGITIIFIIIGLFTFLIV